VNLFDSEQGGAVAPAHIIFNPRRKQVITVYFEARAGAHVVAQLDSEETYMACFPALEQLAMLKGYTITESVDESTFQGESND